MLFCPSLGPRDSAGKRFVAGSVAGRNEYRTISFGTPRRSRYEKQRELYKMRGAKVRGTIHADGRNSGCQTEITPSILNTDRGYNERAAIGEQGSILPPFRGILPQNH